jgi:hypothetical protein
MAEGVTQQFMNYYGNMVKYLNLKAFVPFVIFVVKYSG